MRVGTDGDVQRLARAYRALTLCQRDIVRAKTEREMLECLCRTLVDAGGYKMAWVGYAEDDAAHTVSPVAVAGDGSYLESIRITWSNDDLGKGPFGTAVRTGEPALNRDSERNPDYGPWREEARRHGFRSSIALPLALERKVIGALSVYSTEPDAFDEDERSLLVRFAEDLAFGIGALRAKKTLAELEARLRETAGVRTRFAILDESPGAFAALDREWRCLYINATGARMAGHTPESLIGRVIWDAFPEAKGGPFWDAFHRARDRHEVVELEDHYAPLDLWLEMHVYPIEQGIAVHFSEVTKRKQLEVALRESEERFRQVAENIDEVFSLYDEKENRFVYLSPAYEAIWGRSRQVLYDSPASWIDAIHPDDRDTVLRNGRVTTEPFRIVRPDGGIRWIRVRSFPVRDTKRSAAVAEDITERRVLEEQFRQAQKMEAVGRLAGGVAHDFNNLLSVILTYSALVADRLPSADPLRADLKEIENAGQRAAELTAQLLAFSRQQVLQPKVIDLNESIAKMEKILRRLLGEDIELKTIPAKGLWTVRADPGQIEQILMNLAVNARDAMPDGGKLTIETANVELDEAHAREHANTKAGPHVLVAVSDTGGGMDKATLARIFEPFFTTKGMGKGTGLGLSTVFGIVQQSGGSIWVYSEPNNGTTFKIYLPRTQAFVEDTPPTSMPRELRGTETLLVAEDDAQVRKVVESVLARHGYVVLLATNANDAIRIADEHPETIHALLTDVVMPGMNGRQLAERITARRPGMKVVYMSGYTDNVVVHHGVLDEGIAYIQKPITESKLLAQVREALDA